MGGLSPNLTRDGDAPNIYHTDGRGNPLHANHSTKQNNVPGRYDPNSDTFDPEVFDTDLAAALSLASLALVVGSLAVIVAIPTVIVRLLRRRKSS